MSSIIVQYKTQREIQRTLMLSSNIDANKVFCVEYGSIFTNLQIDKKTENVYVLSKPGGGVFASAGYIYVFFMPAERPINDAKLLTEYTIGQAVLKRFATKTRVVNRYNQVIAPTEAKVVTNPLNTVSFEHYKGLILDSVVNKRYLATLPGTVVVPGTISSTSNMFITDGVASSSNIVITKSIIADSAFQLTPDLIAIPNVGGTFAPTLTFKCSTPLVRLGDITIPIDVQTTAPIQYNFVGSNFRVTAFTRLTDLFKRLALTGSVTSVIQGGVTIGTQTITVNYNTYNTNNYTINYGPESATNRSVVVTIGDITLPVITLENIQNEKAVIKITPKLTIDATPQQVALSGIDSASTSWIKSTTATETIYTSSKPLNIDETGIKIGWF